MVSVLLVCLALGILQQPSTEPATPDLRSIRAFLQIDQNLATSGVLTTESIGQIKQAGYDVVVNLAPAHPERNYLEGFRVAETGMTYLHIPVSWEEPSLRDLEQFFDIMDSNQDRKVFVHCNANMRVSVFVYLYRTMRRAVPEAEARAKLNQIWDPNEQPQWKAFIEAAQSQ